MSPQLEPVAELESLNTHVHNSGSPSYSTPSQRHQSGEGSKWSPTASPRKENELHGEHSSHHKKSLFSKMKEKAKKLQHSLSGKKRHDEESDATLSPCGRSEENEVREEESYGTQTPFMKSEDHKVAKEREEEEEEEVAEYLGAPMYESKKAPEELKETARQHPRETPVITEKNVLSVLPAKHGAETEKYSKLSDSNKTVTESVDDKTKQEYTKQESSSALKSSQSLEAVEEKPVSPSKTVTETVTEKLAPAYAKVSDATHAITKKFQDMAFPVSTEQETDTNDVLEIKTAGTNQSNGFNTKVWDKGVSMKEYIIQKLEPGEDDKALSRVITEAISPRKASAESASFSNAKNMESATNLEQNKDPLIANTDEISEEENHGKILQAN